MCPHTHSSSRKQRNRKEKQGRRGEEKKTELASLQSYFLCTILVCFPQEGKTGSTGKKRGLKIYDTRERNTSKIKKH